MTMRALSLPLCCLGALFAAADAAGQTQLSASQYKSIMASPMIARGDYAKMDSKHKALAACIDWSKVQGDRVPAVPSASYGGDNVDEVKAEAMKACAGLEKDFNCKCRLVDIDGKQAQ